MTERLYVVGGQQRIARTLRDQGNEHWYEYGKGIILEVETSTGTVRQVAEYVSPPETCAPDDPQVLLKSATLVDGILYASTMTEVLTFRVPDFTRPLVHISLPCFNDVHHVRPTPEGNLLVANSGMDNCLELSQGGEVLRTWNTLGEDPWEHFDRAVDYRMVSTKPHRSHPNHVFYIGDEPWATRFQQRDAVSLVDPSRRIDIGLEKVHDGVNHDGRIYFTTVDAKVVIADPERLVVDEVVDLTTLHDHDDVLGWTRGILHVSGGLAWVGFSRIRATKFRENVGFIARGFKRSLPTHIGLYDLAAGRFVKDIDCEDAGLSAVFSILPADG